MGRRFLTVAGLATLAGCAMTSNVPGSERPDPMRAEYLNSGRPNGIEGLSQVVRMGPTVYVSGQVALDAEGRLVGPGDLRAQTTQALENLSHALRIAGATPADVAKMRKLMEPYWDEWAKAGGPKVVEALGQVRKAVGR